MPKKTGRLHLVWASGKTQVIKVARGQQVKVPMPKGRSTLLGMYVDFPAIGYLCTLIDRDGVEHEAAWLRLRIRPTPLSFEPGDELTVPIPLKPFTFTYAE